MPKKTTTDNADLRAIAVGAVFTIESLGRAPGIDRVAEVIYNAMLDASEVRKDNQRKCKVCGREFKVGGYSHPSKCWHCAPVAVDSKKIKRSITNNQQFP